MIGEDSAGGRCAFLSIGIRPPVANIEKQNSSQPYDFHHRGGAIVTRLLLENHSHQLGTVLENAMDSITQYIDWPGPKAIRAQSQRTASTQALAESIHCDSRSNPLSSRSIDVLHRIAVPRLTQRQAIYYLATLRQGFYPAKDPNLFDKRPEGRGRDWSSLPAKPLSLHILVANRIAHSLLR